MSTLVSIDSCQSTECNFVVCSDFVIEAGGWLCIIDYVLSVATKQ